MEMGRLSPLRMSRNLSINCLLLGRSMSAPQDTYPKNRAAKETVNRAVCA